jgi:hypothetical protein
MLVVLYDSGNGDYLSREVQVFRVKEGKCTYSTSFSIECKYIASAVVVNNDVYAVASTRDLVHKYTIEGALAIGHPPIDCGPGFAIHSWNENIYVGTANGRIVIVGPSFRQNAGNKLLKNDQVNSISNNGTTFAASSKHGVGLFKHEGGDKIVNLKYFDLYSEDVLHINYSLVLNDGSFMFAARKKLSSVISIMRDTGPEMFKHIDIPTGRILRQSGDELAVSSEDSSKIEIYNVADLSLVISIDIVGNLKWIFKFNSQKLFYASNDGEKCYYMYNRITGRTKTISSVPTGYAVLLD